MDNTVCIVIAVYLDVELESSMVVHLRSQPRDPTQFAMFYFHFAMDHHAIIADMDHPFIATSDFIAA